MVKNFKRAAPLPAFLKPVVDSIVNAETDEALSTALEKFDAPHKFERPEERSLLNWIEVQERLDSVLARRIAANPVQIPLHIPTGPASGHASDVLTAALVSAGTQPGRNPLGVAVAAASVASAVVEGERAADNRETASTDADAAEKKDLPPPPLELVRHALKASVRLVRNASHDSKHMYTSGDTLVSLLADPDTGIVLMALDALHSLLQRQQRGRMSRALVNYLDAIGRLYALSHGWGGREHGLGMVECCAADESDNGGNLASKLPSSGASVRLDFRKDDVLQLETHSGGILGSVGTSSGSRSAAERALAGVFSGGRPQFGNPSFQPGAGSEPPPPDAAQAIREDAGASNRTDARSREGGVEGHGGADASLGAAPPGGTGNSSTGIEREEHSSAERPVSWYVANVEILRDDEKWLIGPYAKQQGIPAQLRYPLLTAVRRARAFVAGRHARLVMVQIRLLAISCLALFHPTPSALANVFGFDPELLADMVSLACADSSRGLAEVPMSLRIQAVKCATSVCPDRHRFAQLLTSGGVASHHGPLPSLLRAQVAFLVADGEKASKSGDAANSAEALSGASGNGISESDIGISMAETVISLMHNVASYSAGGPGSTGAAALVSSGALGTLVPLLKDKNPRHTRAVTYAIRAMECIIESTHGSSGGSAFRDHSGLDILIQRIVDEVGVDTEAKDAEMSDRVPDEDSSSSSLQKGKATSASPAVSGEDVVSVSKPARSTKAKSKHSLSKEEEEDERVERDALKIRGETRALYDLLGRRQLTALEALKHPSPSSSTASRGMLPHTGWTLLRGLMRLLQLTLGSGNAQIRDVVSGLLPRALRHLVARPFFFGGSLFASAATTTAEIAHAEPTATSALVEAKIGKALLRSIRLGLPPSGEAIRCIPSILAALSLSPSARNEIVAVAPMRSYVARLATPFYGRAMHGETPVHIGNSLDELMRHVEAMRSEGSKALIEFLKSAASFVKEPGPPDLISAAGKEYQVVDNSPRGAPPSSGENGEDCGSRNVEDHSTDSGTPASSSKESARNKLLLLDKMRLTVANNAARLAGFAQGSTEYQNAVVKMNGLQLMLDLRMAAAHAVLLLNKDGTPALSTSRNAPTPHNTITSLANAFRSFCARHGPAVMRAVFTATKEDAAEALRLGSCLEGKWIESEDEAVYLEDRNSPSARDELRKDLNAAVCRLRVDVVILTGLARPGPGWTAGTWKASSAVEVITLIAAVERAARVHIAGAHTGLALQSTVLYGRESSLCGGIVSALDDSHEAKIKPSDARMTSNFISNLLGGSSDDAQKIALAVQSRAIPPGVKQLPRKEVKGVAWALVTFAVSAQNFYSQLSKSLTYNSRRYMRDQSTTGDNIRAMASAIGRALSLHLVAAVPLWDRSVGSSGQLQIPAAWDYIRGVLIELRSCIFDDSRPYEDSARLATDALLLRSFLTAGGGEALLKACRPGSLANSAFADDPAMAFDAEASNIAPDLYSSLVSLSAGASMSQNPLIIGATLQAAREVLDEEKLSADEGASLLLGSDMGRMDSKLSLLASKSMFASRKYAVLMTARDAWSTLNALVNQLSACPGLSYSSPALSPSVVPSSATEPGGVGVTESWSLREVRRSAQALSISVARAALSAPSLTADTREALAAKVLTFVQSVSNSSRQLCQPKETSAHPARHNVHSGRRRGATSALWTVEGRGPGGGGFGDIVVQAGRGHGGRGGGAAGYSSQELEELMDLYPSQFGDADAQAAAEAAQAAVELDDRAQRSAELAPEPNPAVLSSIVDMGFSERQGRRALQRVHPAGLEQAMDWLLAHPDDDDSSGSNDDVGLPGLVSDDDDAGMNDGNVDAEDPSGSSPDPSVERAADGTESGGGGDVAMPAADSGGEEVAGNAEVNRRGLEVSGDRLDEPQGTGANERSQDRPEPVDSVADPARDRPETTHDGTAGGAACDPAMEDEGDEAAATDLCRADGSSFAASSSPAGPQRTQMDESPGGRPEKGPEDESPCESPQNFCRLGPDGQVITAGVGGKWCEGGLLQLATRIDRKELGRVLSRTVKVPAMARDLLRECDIVIGNSAESEEVAVFHDVDADSIERSPSEEQIHPATVRAERQSGSASTTSRKVMRLDPVEIDDYMSAKAGLFEVLERVTRRAVEEAATTTPSENDRPDVGVELLIAMEKDGYLTSESLDNYASLLAAGFNSRCEKVGVTAVDAPVYSLLKSAALWAHHGDLAVRQSLSKTGIGRSALSFIRGSCGRWSSMSAFPSVEESTVQPIEKLSIHESRLDISGSDNVGKDATFAALSHDLRCTTASLLLLDAFVRNQRSDNLLLLANHSAARENSKAAEIDAAGPPGENRSSADHSTPGEEEPVPARMHVDGDEDEVVEALNLEEEEEEMTRARERCDAEIDKQLSETLTDFEKWTQDRRFSVIGPTSDEDGFSEDISIPSGIRLCLDLLLAWKNVEVGDALPALLQFLSSLTQEDASGFLESGGIAVVLGMKELSAQTSCSAAEVRLIRSHVRAILRHTVEDKESLREAMEIELRALVSQALQQGSLTTRGVLKMAQPLLERDISACLAAIAHVITLSKDKSHMREYVSARESRLRKSEGRVDHEASKVRSNVVEVVKSLVALLHPTADALDKMETGIGEENEVSKGSARNMSSKRPSATNSTKDDAYLENALFALDALVEFVSVFPVCCAMFVNLPSPNPAIEGSALDFVVQQFLTLDNERKWAAKPSGVVAHHISEACTHLLTVMCRRDASAHQHVVDALTSAASIELVRKPGPRLSSVRMYAKTISTLLSGRGVVPAFLSSGILDSLLQSLGKMDLNAEGASEVITCVLTAMEILSKVSAGGGSHSSRHRHDELRANHSLMPYIGVGDGMAGHRPLALERRLRHMFANMRADSGRVEAMMDADEQDFLYEQAAEEELALMRGE